MNLIEIFVATAVRICIMEMSRTGGPTTADVDAARAYVGDLCAHGDTLLYGQGEPGQAADLANRLAHAIAVLAHCPGGIDVFGQHFEAQPEAQP